MMQRRPLLRGGGALIVAPALLRHARGADLPRFALGIASGQPRPDGMVLWTLLTGAGLPERVTVRWELAHDEAFTQIAARGDEVAELAWSHSVHAEPKGLEPARWYWYRFSALGQQSRVGRTRTAPAVDAAASSFNFVITSCQRWDVGHYAAWKHVAAEELDAVFFLGDYIYEYATNAKSIRPVEGGHVRTLAQYRARYATHKSDPALQAAHAAAPWLMVWDDHEVGNDYANLQGQELEPDFKTQRAAAYRAYWEHMPFPKSARPVDADMRITGRVDWGRLARIHLVDDRQYRDVQVCPKPGRGGSNTLALKDCPEFMDTRRTLLGMDQERWLADGWDTSRPWNLLAQQTLMARFSRTDPANGGGTYWTDAWDGYPAARQRLLQGIVDAGVRDVVSLGGDVHRHVAADLRVRPNDSASPVVASEFIGGSVTAHGASQTAMARMRRDNPDVVHARGDERGYALMEVTPEAMQCEFRATAYPVAADARFHAQARFAVETGRPGVLPA